MEPQPEVSLPSQPPRSSAKALLIIVLVLAILGAAVSYTIVRNNNAPSEQAEQEIAEEEVADFQSVGPNVLVYGTWGSDSSNVKSLDLETGEKRILARLKGAVKKVSVLSSDRLLYVDNTNERDHGDSLSLHTISTGRGTVAYRADPGFGIDDYVVSPNGKYIAVWEVRFVDGSAMLKGGASRVYAAEVGKSEKYRLYDEVQTGDTPVNYPLAVTDTGEVYTDKFLPNIVHGWGYGMSVSNLQGTQKQEVAGMGNGMYENQPLLSPDGRYLAFIGYSTPRRTTTPENRVTDLAGGNTVGLFDLTTKTKTTLPNLSASDIYVSLRWDGNDGLLLWVLGPDGQDRDGAYAYSLTTRQPVKLSVDNDADWVVGTLGNGTSLVGVDISDQNSIANLGSRYDLPFDALYALDANGETVEIETGDSFMQYITLLPGTYFASQEGGREEGSAEVVAQAVEDEDAPADSEVARNTTDNIDTECNKANTQLCPFYLKKLERETQQSLPFCYEEYAGPMCEKQGHEERSEGWRNCVRRISRPARKEAKCVGSPLYLYGTPGQEVNVSVNTQIYNSNASYEDGYNVTLLPENKLSVGGKVFESLDYDYALGLKRFDRPSYGAVVTRDKAATVVAQYAANLGLNQKETEDIVAYSKKVLRAPYVFVSFFNHETSHELLPLSFTPAPDNYLNVVFYFRQYGEKPDFIPSAPRFSPLLDRSGLTAVEVSAMVE